MSPLRGAVGLTFLGSIAYRDELRAAGKYVLGITLLLLVATVAALIIFSRKRSRRPGPQPLPTPGTRNDTAPAPVETPAPGEWSVDLIRALEWKRFEDLCAGYFRAKGRRAELTELGADRGTDVLLYGENNPTQVLGVVQCKAWNAKPVGVKEIRELLGVMTDFSAPLGVFMTTSDYTPAAREFARGKHIKLMTAQQLLTLILDLPGDVQKALLQDATHGDYTVPSCPSCGIKLVRRTVKRGARQGQQFWGCRNYPRCRFTLYGSASRATPGNADVR